MDREDAAPAGTPASDATSRWRLLAGSIGGAVALTAAALWWARGFHYYSVDSLDVGVRGLALVGAVTGERAWPGQDKASQFDTDGKGHGLVNVGGEIRDYGDGSKLNAESDTIASFAFWNEGLIVLTADGRLGAWTESKIFDVTKKFSGVVHQRRLDHLQSSDDHTQLFLFCGGHDHALYRANGKGVAALTGSPKPITAAAALGPKTVFAVDDKLYELSEPGHPTLLYTATGFDGARILGLAARGRSIYFSTETNVWRLSEGEATLIAAGIGGPLRAGLHQLLVLDKRSGRLLILRGLL